MYQSNTEQVWNFSPPDEILNDMERPLSLPHGGLDAPVPARPLSAMSFEYGRSAGAITEIDMPDAGPSTAPLHHAGFFQTEFNNARP